MGEQKMNKEQILDISIQLLGEITVPIALAEQIAKPLTGILNNLIIVRQMIEKEKEGEENGSKADSE